MAIFVLACVLRFAAIGHQSLSHDEVLSLFDVRGMSYVRVADTPLNYGSEYTAIHAKAPLDWPTMFRVLRRQEGNPPLYFVLLSLWVRLFGTSVAAMRSLSALFGVISILLTAVVGSYLGGRKTGLIAAGVLTVMPCHLHYSQDVRSYALAQVIVLLSTLFFVRLVENGRLKDQILLGLILTLGLYTHYFFAFVILAQFLYVLLFANRRSSLRRVLPALIVPVVLFSPWVLVIKSQATYFATVDAGASGLFENVRRTLWMLSVLLFGALSHVSRLASLAGLVTFAGLLVYGAIFFLRGKDRSSIAAWLAIVPLAMPVLLCLAKGGIWTIPRYDTLFVPGAVIGVVMAWQMLEGLRKRAVFVLLVPSLLFSTAYYLTRPEKQQADRAADFLAAKGNQRALIVTNVTPSLFSYFQPGFPNRIYIADSDAEAKLRNAERGYDEVYLFYLVQSHEETMPWAIRSLESRWTKVDEFCGAGSLAAVYRRP